jgi:hypothetical protein
MDARSGFVMSCGTSWGTPAIFKLRKGNDPSPLTCGAHDDCEAIQNKPDPSRHTQASDVSTRNERKAGNDRE